ATTSMLTRAPKMMRDRMSRPSLSVPSTKLGSPPLIHDGGRRESRSDPANGSCGASSSANRLARASTIRIAMGTRGQPRVRGQRCVAIALARRRTPIAALRMDPRIQDPVGQIDDERQRHEDESEQEHRPLQELVVAGLYRL